MAAKAVTAAALAVVALVAGCSTPAVSTRDTTGSGPARGGWQEDFGIAGRSLVPTGRNRYFVLVPGFQLTLASDDEKLVITVLDSTVEIAGVTARVVEEREWKDGELIEVSRNFFAVCASTGDVFYFGEDVDDYRDGKVVGHGGAWRAGVSDARPGLVMPGSPAVGMKYYQEIAPGVAMDRAEVVGVAETLSTPAGRFDTCLKTREGSAIKTWEREYKVYAPGIGLIQDAGLRLTGYREAGTPAAGSAHPQ